MAQTGKGYHIMAAYTIEDIELIRRKSGITYQEAVSLLDYHNGNVARALVDLERNGRIQSGASREYASAKTAQGSSASGSSSTSSTASSGNKGGKGKGVLAFLSKLYRIRLKLHKDETPIMNLSLLFTLLGLIIAPHVFIIGAIFSLVLGYRFSYSSNDPEFAGDNLERMVRNAAENVKSSVSDFAKGFQDGSGKSTGAAKETVDVEYAERSYYASRPTATASYRADVPTINVPVQVESQDGSVTVEGDGEGFTSATIE